MGYNRDRAFYENLFKGQYKLSSLALDLDLMMSKSIPTCYVTLTDLEKSKQEEERARVLERLQEKRKQGNQEG